MEEEHGRRRARLLKRAAIGVPLAAVAALGAWWWYAAHRCDVKIREEMALFKAEGGSEDIMDLVPGLQTEGGPTHYIDAEALRLTTPYRTAAPGAGGQNGQPSFGEERKAYESFVRWLGSSLNQNGPVEKWDEAWVPHLKTCLADNAEVLQYAKEEAGDGTGGFYSDWRNGFETLLPHLTYVRSAARMLAAEAVLRAREGDTAGALEDVRLMLRMRLLVDREPAAISQGLSHALDAIAAQTLHEVLNAAQIDEPSAQKHTCGTGGAPGAQQSGASDAVRDHVRAHNVQQRAADSCVLGHARREEHTADGGTGGPGAAIPEAAGVEEEGGQAPVSRVNARGAAACEAVTR